MQVLIVGSGGREHALAWKAAQSEIVEKVWVAPGNAGTALETKVCNINIAVNDITHLIKFAQEQQIALTIIGPEAPLALGIVNQFHQANLACFGPSQQAAYLETSKGFAKDFMAKHNIPTARYQRFTEIMPAMEYLRQQTLPVVIKADGLAQGKGVIIADQLEQAEQAVTDMLTHQQFGEAGCSIVIEEFIQGEELSYMVMVDGEHILPLASSQDHKRRDEGDSGPNTGGMGAYSPAPLLTPQLEETILDQVIRPTVKALKDAGTPYTGFLYAGLMVRETGELCVLEFNCRLGDPETQPLMMRLQSDLISLCLSATSGQLNKIDIAWDPRPALTVVLAAGGYPIQYNSGDKILGLDSLPADHDCKIFHAGTRQEKGNIITSGGRVLSATALGDTLIAAQQKAYQLAAKISWNNQYYRRDIGYRALI